MIVPTIALEKQLWKQGFLHVAGVDEAGRGPLAGPVTAGAVIIHKSSQVIYEVRDSKLMSEKQREVAFEKICKKSSGFGVGIVSAEEIDNIGIAFAVQKAMLIALKNAEETCGEKISFVIVDGSRTKILENYQSQRILQGGLYHYSIAAGSILAKVTRDRIMRQLDKEYPEYGFAKHVGYGTKEHFARLRKFGLCAIHRKSFLMELIPHPSKH